MRGIFLDFEPHALARDVGGTQVPHDLLVADIISLEWGNVTAVIGLMFAALALWQTNRANRLARQANGLAVGANDLATQALKMQEDEGRVHLVVKPSILCFFGDDVDSRPRPVVEVINLSAFPVTIDRILWKTSGPEGKWFFWKNPQVSIPFNCLPARLPSREALTAFGTPEALSLEDLQSISAAVAFTACGEQVEGMTQAWRDGVARLTGSAPNT